MSETTKYKYELDGQGFKNKREYNNARAVKCLSESGKMKLNALMNKAIPRMQEKLSIDEVSALKMVHIGFRNSQQKKLNQTLEKTIENLTEKGYVEMILFNYVGGGGVVANARVVLYRKDFSEYGQSILTENVTDPTEQNQNSTGQLAVEPQISTSMELSISDDIDATDSLK